MINHWIFRCKDITELISRSMDETLPLTTRIGIQLHLRVCFLCARYKRQVFLIHRALKKIESDSLSSMPLIPLPEDAARKIMARLKDMGTN